MLINQTEVTPRDVPSLPRFDKPSLVTARWLSPRTRELLRERGFGFLDSTGNAEIALPEPGLYIRTDGAARDPQPKPSASPGMRGPRVWALLRTLIEVAPPYGVTELSRALDLDTDVHWEGMLRQLVSTYSVFDADDTSTWVTSSGPDAFLRDLPGRRTARWAVTGSFGSSRIVPVAAPEVAIVSTDDPERLAKAARLLPTKTGARQPGEMRRPLRKQPDHRCYHMVVVRREVLVQLDDDLVAQLDELAGRLGTNRSELLRRGAQAVITSEELAAADRELVAAYRRQPADPALVRSARRLAAETTPAW